MRVADLLVRLPAQWPPALRLWDASGEVRTQAPGFDCLGPDPASSTHQPANWPQEVRMGWVTLHKSLNVSFTPFFISKVGAITILIPMGYF